MRWMRTAEALGLIRLLARQSANTWREMAARLELRPRQDRPRAAGLSPSTSATRHRGPCRLLTWQSLCRQGFAATNRIPKETANRRFGSWRLAGAKSTGFVLSPRGEREDLCELSDGQARLDRMVIVPPLEFNVVSFDHAIERLAVDTQHARCGLLVAAGMLQHPGDVTAFNF
jgi:hypothetical protein